MKYLIEYTEYDQSEPLSFDELIRLKEMGLIDKAQFNIGRKNCIISQIKKANGNIYDIDYVKKVLDLPGAKKLLELGLHLVSSKTQIINRTFIFSLEKNYNPGKSWGIGFFPEVSVIRRMTPKHVQLGIYGRGEGSEDIIIKRYDYNLDDFEFFDKAMSWAANNIDFDHAKKVEKHPENWRYYTKNKVKSAAAYREAGGQYGKSWMYESEEYMSIDDLNRLLDLGVLSDLEYKKIMYTQNREIYKNKGGFEIPIIKEVMQLTGYKKLINAGVHLVSTKTQLIHGTFVFSINPNYSPYEDWSFGFYINKNRIRRLPPLGLAPRRFSSPRPNIIKTFDQSLDRLSFLDTAMSWAADNLDFNKVTNDPYDTQYHVKNKNK